MRRQKGFVGWYFKHQKGDVMVAFIPGRAQSGAFVQMLSPQGSRQFAISRLSVRGGVLRADGCRFSRRGCRIRLPGVRGEVRYGPLAPLGSDIMGPFQFFPMECCHGVLSMAHALRGAITVEGRRYDFDWGLGYAETDSGISFPRSYLWLQCNDFPQPCSLMIAIARIPFCGLAFRGCICAILYRDKEYRLATYRGVRIRCFTPEHIRLSQGALVLELDVSPAKAGHPLRAPKQGKMSHTIRECCDVHLRARLTQKGKTVFDLQSEHGVYEFVPEAGHGHKSAF